MSVEANGDSLPPAVGVALSPIPIAAVVSFPLSARPRNALPFLAGWTIGIVAIGEGTETLTPASDAAKPEPKGPANRR